MQAWTLSKTVVTTFDKPAPADTQDDETMEFDSHYVFECILNKNQDLIAASASDNTIKLYSYPDMDAVGQMEAHSDTITRVSFSQHRPTELYSASHDCTIKGWDTRTLSSGLTFSTSYEVHDIALGYDDNLIAAGMPERVQFFDVRSSRQLGEYTESHSDAVTQVAFCPDKPGLLATGSEDGLVCVYDTGVPCEDDALVAVMNPDCALRRLGFFGAGSPGLYCLTGTEGLSLWHWGTAQQIADAGDARGAVGAAGGPRLDYLVDCAYDRAADELSLWAGDNAGALHRLVVGPEGVRPAAAATLRGGHRGVVRAVAAAAVAAGAVVTGGEDARLCLWSAPGGGGGGSGGGGGGGEKGGEAKEGAGGGFAAARGGQKEKADRRKFRPY